MATVYNDCDEQTGEGINSTLSHDEAATAGRAVMETVGPRTGAAPRGCRQTFLLFMTSNKQETALLPESQVYARQHLSLMT